MFPNSSNSSFPRNFLTSAHLTKIYFWLRDLLCTTSTSGTSFVTCKREGQESSQSTKTKKKGIRMEKRGRGEKGEGRREKGEGRGERGGEWGVGVGSEGGRAR